MPSTVKYTRELLAEVASQSRDWSDMMRRLEREKSSGLRKRATRLNVDLSHFPLMPEAVPDLGLDPQAIATAAAKSSSIRQLARLLGVGDDSASRKALRITISILGIALEHPAPRRPSLIVAPETLALHVARSTSFAEVMRRSSDLPTRERMASNPDEVLVVHPPGSSRMNHSRLRRAMEAKGVACACAECAGEGNWRGHSITLQIDHISGDWLDNRLENPRFLCPNCHAATATWCAGNRRKRGERLG